MDEGPHLNEYKRWLASGEGKKSDQDGARKGAPRLVLCEFLRCLEECGVGQRLDPLKQAATLTSCWASLTSWWQHLPFREAAQALTLKTLQLINSCFGRLPVEVQEELCVAIGRCSEALGPHMASFALVCRCLLVAAAMPHGDPLLQRLLQDAGNVATTAGAQTSGEACGLTESLREDELLLRLECLRFWEREATVELVCRARLRSCCARCCQQAASSRAGLASKDVVPGPSKVKTPKAGPSKVDHLKAGPSQDSQTFLPPVTASSPRDPTRGGTMEGQCFQELLLCSLYRQRKIREFCKETSGMTCHQGVQLIHSLRSGGGDPERLDVSEALAHVFLVRDLLLPSTYCCTRDLMVLWCELQGQGLEHVGRAAQRLLVPHASASAHFYLFADVLWEHFGRGLFPVYLDMFVRGLTTDINHLEVAVCNEQCASVYELEVHIAGVFAKLSTLFPDRPEIARQCMLSSFALEPTEERLEVLEGLSREIHGTSEASEDSSMPCRCGGRCCGRQTPPPFVPADDGRPEYEADFWHPVLNDCLPGVPYVLLKDFVMVLECLRPRTLTLCSNWRAYLDSYLSAKHGANYPMYCGSADSEMDSTSDDEAAAGPGSLERTLAGAQGAQPFQGGKKRDKRRANAKCKSSHKKKKSSRHHHKAVEAGKDPPRVKKKSKKKGSSHRRAREGEPSTSGASTCMPQLRVLLTKFESLSGEVGRRLSEQKAGNGPTVVSSLTLPNISADLKEPWLVDKDRVLKELPDDDTFQRVVEDFRVGLSSTPLKRFLKFQIRRPILSKKKVPVKVVVRAAKPSLRIQPATAAVIAPPKTPVANKSASTAKLPAAGKSPVAGRASASNKAGTVSKTPTVSKTVPVSKVPPASKAPSMSKTPTVSKSPVVSKPLVVTKTQVACKAPVMSKVPMASKVVVSVPSSPTPSVMTKPLRDYIKITKPSATVAPTAQASTTQLAMPVAPPATPAPAPQPVVTTVPVVTCQAPRIIVTPTMVGRFPVATTTTYSRLVTSAVQPGSVPSLVAPGAILHQSTVPHAHVPHGACVSHLPVASTATVVASVPPPVVTTTTTVSTVASVACHQHGGTAITMDGGGQAFASMRSGQATVLRLPVYSRVIQQHMGQAAIKTDNPPGVCMLPMKLVNAAVLSGQEKTLSVGNQKITINPLPSLLANTSTATAMTVASSSGAQSMMTAKILPAMVGGQNMQTVQQMMRLGTLQGGMTSMGGATVLPAEQLTGQPGLAANLAAALTVPLQGGIATAGGRVIAGKIMIPVNSLLQQGTTLQAGQGMSLSGMPVIILKNQPPPKVATEAATVPQHTTTQVNSVAAQAMPVSVPQSSLAPTSLTVPPASAVPCSVTVVATTAANMAAKKTWMPIRSKPGSMEYRKACNMPQVKVTGARVLAPVTQPAVTYTTPSSVGMTRVTVAPGIQLPCRTITIPASGVAQLAVPMASLSTTMQTSSVVTTSSTGVSVATSAVPVATQMVAPKVITRQVTVPLAKLLQKPPLIVTKPTDAVTVKSQDSITPAVFPAESQVAMKPPSESEALKVDAEMQSTVADVPNGETAKSKEVVPVVKPCTGIHLPFPDDMVDPVPSGATYVPIASNVLTPTKPLEEEEPSRVHRRRRAVPPAKTRAPGRPTLSSSTLRSLTSICDAVKSSLLAEDESTDSIDAEATIKACREDELDYLSDNESERSIEDLFDEEALLLRMEHEDELNTILYVPESNTSEPDYEATPWSSQSLYPEPASSESDPRDVPSLLSEDSLAKRLSKSKMSSALLSGGSQESNLQSPSKFYCEQCNRGFFSAYNLRRHQRNVHKMEFKAFPQQRSAASSPVPYMRETPSPQQRVVSAKSLPRYQPSIKNVVHTYHGHRQNTATVPKQILFDSDVARESDSEETPLLTIKDEPTEPIVPRRNDSVLYHHHLKTNSTMKQNVDRATKTQHGRQPYEPAANEAEGGASPELSKSLDPDDILESLEVAKMSGWSSTDSPNPEGGQRRTKGCTALEVLLAKETDGERLGNHITRQEDALDDINPTVPPSEGILEDVRLEDEDGRDVSDAAWEGLSADDMKAVESLAGEYVTDDLEFFVAPKNAVPVEDNEDAFPERMSLKEEADDGEDALEEALKEAGIENSEVKVPHEAAREEDGAKPCTSHCRTRSREASVKRSCPCCEDSSPKRCRPSPRLTRSASTGKAKPPKKVRTR